MDDMQSDFCLDYISEKSAHFSSSNVSAVDSPSSSAFNNEGANGTDSFETPLSETLESFIYRNRFNALEMKPSGYEDILLYSNDNNSGSISADNYRQSESINSEKNMLFY
jgi:hypothetical protein